MSLLSKAKEVSSYTVKSRESATDEVIELAIAYAKHEVTARQAAGALKLSSSKVHNKLHMAIMSGIRQGKIIYKK